MSALEPLISWSEHPEGDEIYEDYCGSNEEYYRSQLEASGYGALWPLIHQAAISTVLVEPDQTDSAIAYLRETVVSLLNQHSRKLIALHDGLGKSGEAMWSQYFSDLIPSIGIFGLGGSKVLDQYPDYKVIAIDDMSVSGTHLDSLVNSISVPQESIAGFLTVVVNEDYLKIFPPLLRQVPFFSRFSVRRLNKRMTSKSLQKLSKYFPSNQILGNACNIIFDGHWAKAPDNIADFLTQSGLETINSQLGFQLINPNNALICDQTQLVPFYKTREYIDRRKREMANGIARPLNYRG